ncbi:MAG: ATP-binding protein, partial [Candidatus Omnitrophica bacterium]|nr:ATP-binding protein [Candidatus Omnitrophota bacterium]
EDVGRALEDTKQRISAMGKVHRMLYLSKNFSEIDFSEYIRSLIDEIKITYGTSQRRIKITLDLEPVILNIDTAIPCGLIINELLVNAFRHAFPDRARGHIAVSLKRKGKNIELKIKDDGTGMAVNPLSKESKALGLRLVTMLSQQLSGKISYKGKKGSLFTIVFKSVTIKPNKS